jgi:thiamine-phosphate pyrophosphorylase
MVSTSSRALLAQARLYAITPDRSPAELERLVGVWLDAGVAVVQLRQSRLARGKLLDLARRLVATAHAAGALLIVNDQLDIALLAEADGVHLGPDDLSVAAARRVAGPDLIVGASAASADAAREAESAGADYLGSGPAFATANKTTKLVIGPAGIAGVAAAVRIPVFAIGGITPARVPELRLAGIDRVSAIGALSGEDAAAAVREFQGALA